MSPGSVQELKNISQQYKDSDTFPADSGKLSCNKKKNRFKDILPCETRAVCSGVLVGRGRARCWW